MRIINEKRYPTENLYGIYGFFGKYKFLSNFQIAPVVVDGITFKSSENAYMAQKTLDTDVQKMFSELLPYQARKEGQKISLRNDWEIYKPFAMLKVVRAKFTQNVWLAELLLSTNLLYLEETNNWGDQYWGVCNGSGLNMLGKTLMQVRNELHNYHE